jgi:hypothetical protein
MNPTENVYNVQVTAPGKKSKRLRPSSASVKQSNALASGRTWVHHLSKDPLNNPPTAYSKQNMFKVYSQKAELDQLRQQ